MVVPTIIPGNSVSGYEVENSVRFNDNDSPELDITYGSAGNRRTFTWSGWIKRSNISQNTTLFANGEGGTSYFKIKINDVDKLYIVTEDGSTLYRILSTQVLRDPSAWYHIVAVIDTTDDTAGNRLRQYINGVEVTAFDLEAQPSENYQTLMNTASKHDIGYAHYSDSEFLDGYMSEIHFIDGAAKAPTDFGEFDDNGVWIPKAYTGTYGNNGFFLEFKQTGTSANSSGIGADTSGNDHHWAVTNLAATDVTEDTCTNNFATMNPLESDRQQGGAATFAEGNLQITTSYVDADRQRYPQVYSTQAVSSGKWYFEMKISTSDVDSSIGIFSPDNHASDSTTNPYGGYATTGCIFTDRGSVRINDGQTTGLGTWSQNDIVGCALDIDNDKVYFHRNGTYVQSGDPAGNSGGQAIPSNTTYGFSVGCDKPSDSGTMQVNFGNPIYTISSGNTDGKYGNFEYAVPSGFYAVCTKRLAEFG